MTKLSLFVFILGLIVSASAMAYPRECRYDGRGVWVCSTPAPEYREHRDWYREHHDWRPMPLWHGEHHRWREYDRHRDD